MASRLLINSNSSILRSMSIAVGPELFSEVVTLGLYQGMRKISDDMFVANPLPTGFLISTKTESFDIKKENGSDAPVPTNILED